MHPRITLFITLMLLTSAASLPAAMIHVDASGGGDYETIQDGIIAASDGDIVLVAPGIYEGDGNEAIDFYGKEIELLSSGGPDITVIEGPRSNGHGGAFTLTSGETAETVTIEGFTIRDGRAGYDKAGGAIYCRNASATVRNCVFEDCYCSVDIQWCNGGYGGAVYFRDSGSRAVVEDCIFTDCTAEMCGGAIYARDSDITITGCTFKGNRGHYCSTVALSSSSASVDRCAFVRNGVGHMSETEPVLAISGTGMSTTVTNCTFVDNAYSYMMIKLNTTPVTMASCILGFNRGSSELIDGYPFIDPFITHCVVFGNAGGDSLQGDHEDNLFVDPLLCGYATGDVFLCADSPCLPGSPHNPWGELVGALEEGCGECFSVVEERSWGVIKAMYR